jgi:hypothetical protein
VLLPPARAVPHLVVHFLEDGSLFGSLAHFQLAGNAAIERKLAQYPSGTAFELTVVGEPPRVDEARDELLEILRRLDMRFADGTNLRRQGGP